MDKIISYGYRATSFGVMYRVIKYILTELHKNIPDCLAVLNNKVLCYFILYSIGLTTVYHFIFCLLNWKNLVYSADQINRITGEFFNDIQYTINECVRDIKSSVFEDTQSTIYVPSYLKDIYNIIFKTVDKAQEKFKGEMVALYDEVKLETPSTVLVLYNSTIKEFKQPESIPYFINIEHIIDKRNINDLMVNTLNMVVDKELLAHILREDTFTHVSIEKCVQRIDIEFNSYQKNLELASHHNTGEHFDDLDEYIKKSYDYSKTTAILFVVLLIILLFSRPVVAGMKLIKKFK